MGFRLATIDGRAVLVHDESWHDLAAASGGAFGGDPMEAIARNAELHDVAAALGDRAPEGSVDDASFGPPIPAPRNSLAVGLNYADHAGEAEMELPQNPLVFTKFPSCIVGPTDEIDLRSERADYEAELVVVIGTGGRDIAAADAWSHVAGLMNGQDISDRRLQFAAKPPHFDLGKSRDTYGPTGPILVSTDLIDDPADLDIVCRVNGETRQSSNTRHLIFDVPTLVEYISAAITLAPGDMIFTGTPEGVGSMQGKYLAPGDVVETEIAGLGVMRNVCA